MYSWKPGARVRTDANTVGAICEQMAKDGRLTAANLVDDSRPEDAPLHNEFTWDDSLAAESWRRQEAMQIINGIEIRIENSAPVQAFVKLTRAETDYRPTSILIRQADTREQLIENALRELKGIQRKYSALKELADVFTAIEAVKIA